MPVNIDADFTDDIKVLTSWHHRRGGKEKRDILIEKRDILNLKV